jgi:hypothetical protein
VEDDTDAASNVVVVDLVQSLSRQESRRIDDVARLELVVEATGEIGHTKSDRPKFSHFTAMVLGACVIWTPNSAIKSLHPDSIKIEGQQAMFIAGFTVSQVFKHDLPSPQQVSYIVPNNSKICMYDTTFRIGGETIRPVLEEKKRAEEIFLEATAEGRAALLGSNLGNGLVEFKLGNLPPGKTCEVIVKCGFTVSSSGPSSLFFKFPLETCTPSGSVECITRKLGSAFSFTVAHVDAASVANISSNVAGRYLNGRYEIDERPSASSIMVTTEMASPLGGEYLRAGDTLAVTCYSADLGSQQQENNEFVFVVDCSGSMSGQKIRHARDCLKIFIRSLPPDSFFNVVRFGTRFECLFTQSSIYNEENVRIALVLAESMQANLGGTELYGPLDHIYKQPLYGRGTRQIFVLTDGEVDNTDQVVGLAASNQAKNRVFTLGIGSGADAGLVEGLANTTGGRADFVTSNEDLSGKVIPQLETSLSPSLNEVEIHVSGHDSIEISPYPLLPVTKSVSATYFVKLHGPGEVESVLMSGDLCGERQDLLIEHRRVILDDRLLSSLYAYETLRCLERDIKRPRSASGDLRAKSISLSIASGILCNATAFVGVSERIYRAAAEPEPAAELGLPALEGEITHALPMLRRARRAEAFGFADRLAERAEIPMALGRRRAAALHENDAASQQDEGSLDLSGISSLWAVSPASPPPLMFAAPPSRPTLAEAAAAFRRAPAAAAPPSHPAPAAAALAYRQARAAAAPPSHPAPAATAAPVPQNPLMGVIELQGLDGSWPNPGSILTMAGVQIEQFGELAALEPDQRSKAMATILALAFLRKRCSGQRSTWQMIERKALAWLLRLGVQHEDLIARAMAAF